MNHDCDTQRVGVGVSGELKSNSLPGVIIDRQFLVSRTSIGETTKDLGQAFSRGNAVGRDRNHDAVGEQAWRDGTIGEGERGKLIRVEK